MPNPWGGQRATDLNMPTDSSTPPPEPDVRTMHPDACYRRINDSELDDHLSELSINNLLRADARVRIYDTLLPFVPDSIADIGCGVGLTTSALKRAHPDATVYGYEIDASATAYAAREDKSGAEYRTVAAGMDVTLDQKFDVLLFQEFYPFTRTPDFQVHREFLQFIVNNLTPRGLALIQLAIRHPEITILNHLPSVETFCRENAMVLSQHLIPYDRLVDVIGSVRLSALLTPPLSMITGTDRRIVLMLRKSE